MAYAREKFEKERQLLKMLSKRLRGSRYFNFKTFHTASFGNIAKLSYPSEGRDINIDITMNKVLETWTSNLILEYTKCDIRFVQLALFLKDWNKLMLKRNHKLITSGLNSFTLVLMIIAYLQHYSVLPCLQGQGEKHVIKNIRYKIKVTKEAGEKKYSLKFAAPNDIEIQFERPKDFELIGNTSSVGDLLVGFFQFYANFDYANQAILINQS